MKYDEIVLADLPTEYLPDILMPAKTNFLLSGTTSVPTLYLANELHIIELDLNIQTITEDYSCILGSDSFGLFFQKSKGEKIILKAGKKEISLPTDCFTWTHIKITIEDKVTLTVSDKFKTIKAKLKSELITIGYIGTGFGKAFIKNLSINNQSQILSQDLNLTHNTELSLDSEHFIHFPTRANAPEQLGAFSIEFWYKEYSKGTIVKIGTTDSNYKGFELSSVGLDLKPDFNHIVLTIEKNTHTVIRQYINGKKISKIKQPLSLDGIPSFGGQARTDLVMLGGHTAAFEIKDFALYRNRLNKHQVRAHYEARIPEVISEIPKAVEPTKPYKYTMRAWDSFQKNHVIWSTIGTIDMNGEKAGRNPANLTDIVILAKKPQA